MQLLRDNLTLWTSSDSQDAEGAKEEAAPAATEEAAAPVEEKPTEETKPAEES